MNNYILSFRILMKKIQSTLFFGIFLTNIFCYISPKYFGNLYQNYMRIERITQELHR